MLKKLIVSLFAVAILLAVMVVPALAADTNVTLTVTGYIDVTAPQPFQLTSNQVPDTFTGQGTGSVSSNYDPGTYAVTAVDAKGTDTGYMTTGVDPVVPLTNMLGISGNGGAGYSFANTPVNMVITEGLEFTLNCKQLLDPSDPPGGYQIVITFTGNPL